MDSQTVYEQEIWEYYKRIESENFHLKNQLNYKNKQIKDLKRSIAHVKMLLRKVKCKPKYRNKDKKVII